MTTSYSSVFRYKNSSIEKGNGKLPNLGRNTLLGSGIHFVLTLFVQQLQLSKSVLQGELSLTFRGRGIIGKSIL